MNEELFSRSSEGAVKQKNSEGRFWQESETTRNNDKAQKGNSEIESELSVSEHDVKKKKHKKKKDDEDEEPQSSIGFGVDTEALNKHKKNCLLETVERLSKKKKKKKDVGENERMNELPSPGSQLDVCSEQTTKEKKHKKEKREDECRNLNIFVCQNVNAEAECKKKKRSLENQQEQESDVSLVKKKHVDESETEEEKHKKKKQSGDTFVDVGVDTEVSRKKKMKEWINLQIHEENIKKKKCKKKKKESVCENLHTYAELDADTEVSKNHNKRKLETEKQENDKNLVESEETEVTPKRKKKKHVEGEFKEELLSPASTQQSFENKNIDSKMDKNEVKKELFSSGGQIQTGEKIERKIEALIEDSSQREKHKKNNKENKCGNINTSVELDLETDLPKKNFVKHEEQHENETVTAVVPPKKGKNEHIAESEKMKQQSSTRTDRRKRKDSETKQKRGVLKLKEIFSAHNFDSDDTDEELLEEEVALLEAEAQKIKEKNRLSFKEEQKLRELKITVPWPVPPLHMIETRITMRPNEEQSERIKDLGVQVKAATYYSKMEDEQITKNWKEFCRMHDLLEDSKPFQNMVNPDGQNVISIPERLNFARFLAHNLNDRLLCSVYKRFRRLFPQEQLKTGSRFTPEEDRIITKYIRKSLSRTPYADLGALLGRNKLAIEKRARILGEEASFGNRDVKWNNKRIEEFVKNVMDVTQVNNVNELESRQITNEEWHLLEERLNIPVRKLQKGWACRIFPTLFAKSHSCTMKVKRSLVRILLERGEDDFKNVDWSLVQKELGKDGHGFTGRGLHELLQGMIYHWVPVEKRNDSKASLKYLQQACQSGGIRGRRLRKIQLSDDTKTNT